MTTKPVITFGEALIDLIVADDEPSLTTAGALAIRPGGAPANVAVALAQLGVPSAFCGAVGNDPYLYGNSRTPTLVFEGVQVAGL